MNKTDTGVLVAKSYSGRNSNIVIYTDCGLYYPYVELTLLA